MTILWLHAQAVTHYTFCASFQNHKPFGKKSIAIKYYKNQQIVTNMKWGNDMVALFVICHMNIYLCLSSIIVVEYSDDDGDYTMSNSLWSFFFSFDDSVAYHVLHFCLIIYKLRLTTHTYTNTPGKERKKKNKHKEYADGKRAREITKWQIKIKYDDIWNTKQCRYLLCMIPFIVPIFSLSRFLFLWWCVHRFWVHTPVS